MDEGARRKEGVGSRKEKAGACVRAVCAERG